MQDALGERMKSQYEHRTRFFVPRRTYTVIRLDGKAFHTYTRGLQKPFDEGLYNDMDNAIIAMMPQIQGSVFAYTQSDEISILLTDFATPTTSAWFDGNLQKMASVSASIITAEFNKQRWERDAVLNRATPDFDVTAYFDSRVYTIPDRTEVMNYFIWRNQDCARNAVSMVAQSKFSHGELQGKSTAQMQEMLYTRHGVNWSKYREDWKNGRLIVKETYIHPSAHYDSSMLLADPTLTRSKWVSKPAWKFTENKDKLLEMVPKYT